MEIVAFILSPIIGAMGFVLDALHAALSSYGWSIVMLSVLVRLILLPLTNWARDIEEAEAARQRAMRPAIDEARRTLNGRERFERIDSIYVQHNYHPISSMRSAAAFGLQIPFLLAALYLLSGFEPLVNQPFLIVRDLSAPDGLLDIGSAKVNVLPILLTIIAFVESAIMQQSSSSRIRFTLISLTVLILIYSFPAAVSLYWLTNNAFSLVSQIMRQAFTRENQE
ncbi:YidC/Oxa1 family membrane protein insertase [Shinella sumterensis]|uniref:YidC/Oxa1 family membrane protein insertase n=1 Tax=Shinella sumterensis TaxID=1967501 RepID=UPI003F859182